jgi:hypothetical protein
MSKTGKILGGSVLTIVAVVVIVTLVALQNLDGIIKNVIETVGSQVTQTKVTVAEVKFSLTDGRGEIRGLKIGNPPGYKSAHALSMKEVAVELDPASLTGSVFVIKEVLIDGADLIVEQKGTTTNLKDLLKTMNSGAAASEPAPAAAASEPAAAAASGGDVRLMLEEFAFTGTTATVTSSTLGKISLKMPAIRMQNIGDKETGLTPQQLANRMVKTLFKQVEASVGKSLKKMAKKAGQDALEGNLSEDAKGKLDGLKSLFKKKT